MVLFSETVFLWKGPRVFIEKTSVFAHLEQHLHPMVHVALSLAREVHRKLPMDRARLEFENGSNHVLFPDKTVHVQLSRGNRGDLHVDTLPVAQHELGTRSSRHMAENHADSRTHNL